MSGTVERGLRGILSACCVTESPVPFMCSSKTFQDGDKTITFKIIDGKGQKKVKENKSNNENESETEKGEENAENAGVLEEKINGMSVLTGTQNKEEEEMEETQNTESEKNAENPEDAGVLEEKINDMSALIGTQNKEETKENESNEDDLNKEEGETNKEEGETNKKEGETNKKEGETNNEEELNNEEETEEETDFDYTFDVDDRVVHGEEDTEFKEDIMTICEYIRESVSTLYDSQVVSFRASFGAKTEGHKIWLLDGDIATSANGFSQNLFRSVPGGEVEFIDFLIDQLSETNKKKEKPKQPQKTAKTHSKSGTLNDTPKNSSRSTRPATSNGYYEKCQRYDQRNASKGFKRCYSGFSTCLSAHYRVPRIFVFLYRARRAFPHVNRARLYRLIEQRLEAVDPNAANASVDVCIKCVHLYTAEERSYQGQKLTNEMPKDVPSHPFASLVPAELSIKGNRDVGFTPDMYRPFCYKINCRDSPYRENGLKVKKPLQPPERSATQKIPKSEKWVMRLSNPYRAHSVIVVESSKNTQRSSAVNKDSEVKLPPIEQTRQSYSEKLAPNSYTNKPFNYAFLEKMKKKNEMLVERSKRLNNKWKNEYQ